MGKRKQPTKAKRRKVAKAVEAVKPQTVTKLEVALRIFERVWSGKSVSQALRDLKDDPDVPVRSTFYLWLADDKELSRLYLLALTGLADHYFDEIIEIADYPMSTHEEIGRARVRIDTRKWVCARIAPWKYGEKVENPESQKQDKAELPVLDLEPQGKLSKPIRHNAKVD